MYFNFVWYPASARVPKLCDITVSVALNLQICGFFLQNGAKMTKTKMTFMSGKTTGMMTQ